MEESPDSGKMLRNSLTSKNFIMLMTSREVATLVPVQTLLVISHIGHH